ncbi:hypothetical protein SAMN05421505_15321 [Sinosporangium album]|uniref:Uncharacterized protein n=1 Tax=Sinosporangium album TaxID=504805 RepID=A0A1G8KQ75_9ACTN|nr:hypothetical protein SAMN05421505_15321 [Sinosporangium album]
MSESRKDGQAGGRRLSSRTTYLLSLLLNFALGLPGQFALFYPYFVVRNWLAQLGVGTPGIPFHDGYLGALLIGLALTAAWGVITAGINLAVLRYSRASRRLYWPSAVLVALSSSSLLLLWNMGSPQS